ncbi:hypothetical protein ACVWZV_000629 [Bradyrhizobium sp. GM5.1]
MIAATWSAITKPAPMMAARIWATNRVRAGPIRRNSRMVTAIAIAAADRPIATTTPNAASQRAPPPNTSTSMKGVENSSAITVMASAIAAMRTENRLASVAGEDMMRSRSARA